MSYKAGEAALLTLIQTLSDFSSANSISLANDSTGQGHVLQNKGVSHIYVKLRPGEFDRSFDSVGLGSTATNWITIIEVAVFRGASITKGKSAERQLAEARDDIIAAVDAYHRLNNSNVQFAQITEGSEIEEDTIDKLGAYISQELYCSWIERTTHTQSD